MKILVLLLVTLAARTGVAQPEREAILKPIHELFAAMKEGDSLRAHRAFADGSTFDMVISNGDQKP
jgi:hypothetical protein